MKILKSKSSIFTLFINLKLEHVINPWRLIVDYNQQTITISKRNWYFIGTNSDTIAFRFIRKITINEHLFGADIYIKAIGGSVSAKYLPKKDLREIKVSLVNYNMTKRNHIIFS
jgi:hypothetical protein